MDSVERVAYVTYGNSASKDDFDENSIEVPEIPSEEYENEVKKIVDVKNKKWNTHMLRVCTKYLVDIPKKDFKKERYSATLSHNIEREKEIMEQMLCNKVKTLNFEEFSKFYKKLCEFESKKHLHPRHKYIDY